MSTHCKTTIYDKDEQPILTFFSHHDGYFKGHGERLQNLLKEHIEAKDYICANSMEYLAYLIFSNFFDNTDPDEHHICKHDNEGGLGEYTYHINCDKNGKFSLIGRCEWTGVEKTFPLYSEPEPEYNRIAEFVYPSHGGPVLPRKIGVTLYDDTYLEGYDLNENNKFKRFRVDKIRDGELKLTIL